MAGVVGYLDRRGDDADAGAVVARMLVGLTRHGRAPDCSGVAVMRGPRGLEPGRDLEPGAWRIRIAPVESASALEPLHKLGQINWTFPEGETRLMAFQPRSGITIGGVERVLKARRGGREVISAGASLDLVKHVGPPEALDASYDVSTWGGWLGVGAIRDAIERRVELGQAPPFWIKGALDYAVVHAGRITNSARWRDRLEARGAEFGSDQDGEVLAHYLRDRLGQGQSLLKALQDALEDLDGAFTIIVAAPEGLGVVRDPRGLVPLVQADDGHFLAVASEEAALRFAVPGTYRVYEPPPGVAVVHAGAGAARSNAT